MSNPRDNDSNPGSKDLAADPVERQGGDLHYVPNPKHDEPWQRGRRGSLCPKEISRKQAQKLLDDSELAGGKRYAVHEGRPYWAQDDGAGGWHGYPIGWKEVPSKLRTRWEKREKRVKKREIDRHWESHK
jgi:filamentous hemagglutinin